MLQPGQIGGRISKKSAGVAEKDFFARVPRPIEVESYGDSNVFGQVVAHGFGVLQAGQIGGRISKKSPFLAPPPPSRAPQQERDR